METIGAILFSPNVAFSRMKCEGGIGRPLGFSILGDLAGQMGITAFFGVIALIGVLMKYSQLGDNAPDIGKVLLGLVLAFLLHVFLGAIGSLVRSTIGVLISSAIVHLALKITLADNKPFETTMRVIAFLNGAFGALLAVPVAGWIAIFFGFPVYFVLALANAHETSAVRNDTRLVCIYFPVCRTVCCSCSLAYFYAFLRQASVSLLARMRL